MSYAEKIDKIITELKELKGRNPYSVICELYELKGNIEALESEKERLQGIAEGRRYTKK